MKSEHQTYYDYYPTEQELEAWIDQMHADSETASFTAEIGDPYTPTYFGEFHSPSRIVKFTRDGHEFWGMWHPKASGAPAPLLIHLPGYGGELSSHWDVAAEGYNLLHLSPLGYWTPRGMPDEKRENGEWPVLPDTVRTFARGGYREWILDVICAVRWAWTQAGVMENRVSFYGTSQGGGTALLLGSVFKDRGTASVCADVPFLINFPLADFRGAYSIVLPGLKDAIASAGEQAAWKSIGYVDNFCHADRMNYPVLLVAGGKDALCPADTVVSLFEKLNTVKSFTLLPNHPHAYNPEFIKLACAWFDLYA